MKSAMYAGIGKIGVHTVEKESPPPGFIQIDTKCTGICGSDLHAYFGRWEQLENVASGHEFSGVVAELGEGVSGFEISDRVTAECFSHCGTCLYCKTGLYNHCLNRPGAGHNTHGGFAEFSAFHASATYKLPPEMSFEEGAMVEPLAVAHRAVSQASIAQTGTASERRIAVIGGGTIGQLCMAVAKSAGFKEALIAVKYDCQAELAQELGADHVIRAASSPVEAETSGTESATEIAQSAAEPGNGDLRQLSKDITEGLGMDAVIDTVGTADTFNDAMDIVRRRGTVVLLAGYHSSLDVDIGRVVGSEAIITGSNCYGYSGMQTDFQAAIDLIAKKRIDVGKLVTHRFSLNEISEAFETAADKKSGSIKVHVCQ